uniref:Putative secreted protein n=1 Tax=Anopheles darlingi TaxID=43151 RepID=A0A2M4DM49_ANODA
MLSEKVFSAITFTVVFQIGESTIIFFKLMLRLVRFVRAFCAEWQFAEPRLKKCYLRKHFARQCFVLGV